MVLNCIYIIEDNDEKSLVSFLSSNQYLVKEKYEKKRNEFLQKSNTIEKDVIEHEENIYRVILTI